MTLILVNCQQETGTSHQELRDKHRGYLESHPFQKTLKMTKEERIAKRLPPNKYFEEQFLLEMDPELGRPTPEKKFKLQQELRLSDNQKASPGDVTNQWIERGPDNVGGRTRVVFFDPNDSTNSRVFAGGVSGGLWVNNDITNATSVWQRVNIPENLSITCYAIDPNNSNIWYLGTGESYVSGDVNGNGIWRSTDGGVTWTNVFGGATGASTTGAQTITPGFFHVNDIVCRNVAGTTEVYAGMGAVYYSDSGGNPASFMGAFELGLYRSTDGINYSRIPLYVTGTTPFEPNDLEIAPDNTLWMATRQSVFGNGGGYIFSSVDGTNYTLRHFIANTRRTEIEISNTNSNKIYALSDANPINFVRTTNAFATVTNIALPNDADLGIPANDFTRGQAFYDLVVEANPNNDNIVYAGGIDIFRSTNSGNGWTQISKWSNNANLNLLSCPTVHADQHALTFHPTNPNRAVLGTDGGVYYASSLSTAATNSGAIVSRNNGFNVTQFYTADIGPDPNNELLLGGTQDNGSPFFNGTSPGINSSFDVFGGDGAYEFIDKDENYMVVSYVYNYYARLNLPYTGAGVFISTDTGSGSFINPADLDENLNILYTNGNGYLTRFSNLLGAPVRANLFNPALSSFITAIKVSPYTTTSSTVLVGTQSGQLFMVTNANTTPNWTEITDTNFIGSISDVEFGTSEQEIMVTFHNYNVDSIWFTTDGGTTWLNKEGDFPDIPVKSILMNTGNTDEVIIGTDLGIWVTDNFNTTSPNWLQSQSGMQNVKVTSLNLRPCDQTILASTYGRGLFTSEFRKDNIVWTGAVSTDWFDPCNWDSYVPRINSAAIIPGGLTNYPVISGAMAMCCRIEIDFTNGASVIIDTPNGGKLETNSGNCPTP